MATITLKYQKNQSHEIRVENLNINYDSGKWKAQETSSFFMDEYTEAIEMVNAIIALCDGKKEEGEKKGSATKESESINNRILFVGQRGTGKTSAMTSFAKALNEAKIGKKNVFKPLPLIDPSNFDNNTNILLTVITMLFSEAKNMMKNDKNDEDIISIREDLLRKFDEVFKSLKAITNTENPTFTLEGLNEKSRALQMRTGMHGLVKSYIEFYNKVYKDKAELSHLVLLIDDIDMTVSHVPEMLEQLRKYLDLDNLIILMSANLGQLYNEMREHYSKSFKETLNDRNQALSIDVEDLASKYLLKLFPTSRRIRVEHNVNQLLNTILEINNVGPEDTGISFSNAKGSFSGSYRKEDDKYSGNFEINVFSVNGNNTATPYSESIIGHLQKVILSLIWRKTRLLFTPKDINTILHPIIPTNLRELMQFLDMLTSLKSLSNNKDNLFGNITDYNNCKDNLGKFKSYILHNWIPNHLSVEEELVFENIPTDITEINKHLINAINMIGTNHKKAIMSREVGLDIIERNAENVYIDRDIYTMVSPNDPKFVKANKISDIFNQPSNYSYGDLLLMIDKYETYFESGDDRKFTDAIKVYYSILLFETLFFDSTMVVYDLYKVIAQAICLDEAKRALVLEKHPEFKEFAGDALSTELGKIIFDLCNKKERNELGTDKDFFEKLGIDDIRQSVSSQIIPIQKLIGGTVYYPNYFEIIKDKYFNQKGPSFDAKRAFYHKLPVNEGENVGENYPFYAVLYYGDIRPDRYDTKHIYDTTFENDANIDGTDYVTFDILSILSNMLNPWHTYNRANGRVNEKDSWMSNIMEWGKFCTIDDPKDSKNNVLIPNSILPFYSVDMMLNYLKESYEVSNIIKEYPGPTYKEYDNYKVGGRNVLFSATSTDSNPLRELAILSTNFHLNHLIDDLKLDDSDSAKLKKQLVEKKYRELKDTINGITDNEELFVKHKPEFSKTGKNTKKWQTSFNKWGNEFSYLKQKICKWITFYSELAGIKPDIPDAELLEKLKEPFAELLNELSEKDRISLFHYADILAQSVQSLKKTIDKAGTQHCHLNNDNSDYLNKTISLLLEKYPESQKERDTLIKELHKYSTPSEIFKHLVESLWDNKLTEILIRSDIQQRVRRNDSVAKYYIKLWEKTKQLIDIADDNAIKVYYNIFNKAAKTFINKDHADQ